MASPAAGLLEEWLPRDPRSKRCISPRAGSHASNRASSTSVVLRRTAARALLIAETHAAAFDPDGQTARAGRLRASSSVARGSSHADLEVAGSGYFSSIIKNRTQREAAWFGGGPRWA